MSGSEIMEELEKRTGGRWKPSPGSVYPLLAWLLESGYTEEVPKEKLVGESVEQGSTPQETAPEPPPVEEPRPAEEEAINEAPPPAEEPEEKPPEESAPPEEQPPAADKSKERAPRADEIMPMARPKGEDELWHMGATEEDELKEWIRKQKEKEKEGSG